jgi:hypothetical protein
MFGFCVHATVSEGEASLIKNHLRFSFSLHFHLPFDLEFLVAFNGSAVQLAFVIQCLLDDENLIKIN